MQTEQIKYMDGDVTLHGYLAIDDPSKGKRPVVLVAHDWTGRNEFACQKAEQLAKMGYVGCALDRYGEGQQGESKEEKAALMQQFMVDRSILQKRITAALQTVKNIDLVDSQQIAAIGFCFGGLCVLDLARTGADIKGVVSFHGIFVSPTNIVAPEIKAKVLALQGHDDPMVPPEQVLAFEKEMTAAGVDWQLHAYGQTMHAFTNPQANDADFGTVYNAVAEIRSWQTTQNFFTEIFTQ